MFTERQQQILNTLTSQGKTTGDALAAALQVSKRTIYRDLTALMDAGIPVRTEGGPRGGIWIEEVAVPPAETPMTEAHAPARTEEAVESQRVSVVEAALARQVGEPRAQSVEATPSVQNTTPAGIAGGPLQVTNLAADLAAQMRERVYLDASGWWQEDAPSQVTVDILQDAIFSNRAMRIHFTDAPDAPSIEPYGLVAKAGVWYLVSRQGATFVADRLSRIQSAVAMDRRFERLPGFNLAAWWNESGNQFVTRTELYRFVALVRRSRIEFLRLYVGGGLQVDPVDAQWVRARFEVGSPEAAVMIVLGLGQDAVVIEPNELPLMVRRAAAGRPIHDAGSAPTSAIPAALTHAAPAHPAPAVAVQHAPAVAPQRTNGLELFPSTPIGTVVHG